MHDKEIQHKINFGIYLKRAIKRAGLTQETLAARMEIDKRTISNWCNNHTSPSIDEITVIENILGNKIQETTFQINNDYLKGRYDEAVAVRKELIDRIETHLKKCEYYYENLNNNKDSPLIRKIKGPAEKVASEQGDREQ